MKYCLKMEMKGLPSQPTTGVNFTIIILVERSDTKMSILCNFVDKKLYQIVKTKL